MHIRHIRNDEAALPGHECAAQDGRVGNHVGTNNTHTIQNENRHPHHQ
jgi:hypothetical protein